MRTRMPCLLLLTLLIQVVGLGCTHVQLRNSTLSQMQTVHDIQQQQVLDNLAMFVANPDAFPYFSLPTQGNCTVTDGATLAESNSWARSGKAFVFSALNVSPGVSRSLSENWTLNPVNDSVKLTLMRCVYQRVVSNCTGNKPSCMCPDCEAVFQAFYQLPKQTLSPMAPGSCGTSLHADLKTTNDSDVQGGATYSIECQASGIIKTSLLVTITKATGPVDVAINDQKVGTITPVDGKGSLVISSNPTSAETAWPPNVTMNLQTGTVISAGQLSGPLAPPIQAPGGPPPAQPAGSAGSQSQPQQLLHVPGIITPYCLANDRCWFCVGPKCAVPKDGCCNLVGHYCDTWIWVPPAGRDEFSKLAILIVDIAFYNPPQPPAPPMVTITNGTVSSVAVPLGVNPQAVSLAPYNARLKRFLAQHGLTEYGLMDYWSRGIAGPGMSSNDVAIVVSMLNDLGIYNWGYSMQLLDPDKALQTASSHAKSIAPDGLAYVWMNHLQIPDLDFVDQITLLNYWRVNGCNPISRLGSDTLDRIAYDLLGEIGKKEQENDCTGTMRRMKMAECAKMRFADLELDLQPLPRTPTQFSLGLPAFGINAQANAAVVPQR
jgi:hypothetical protein